MAFIYSYLFLLCIILCSLEHIEAERICFGNEFSASSRDGTQIIRTEFWHQMAKESRILPTEPYYWLR